MLVLTRRKGETIFIGEDIRVVVVSIHGGQAKIGIACPSTIPVMRSELGTRIKKFTWPNLSPEEMAYLLQRHEELSEWWLKSNAVDSKKERHDLAAFIEDLERWALREFIERHV